MEFMKRCPSAVAPVAALVAAFVVAVPAPAQAQSSHDGWVDVISVSMPVYQSGGAAATTTGKARLAEPPANTRRPTRLVLIVPRGPLQQALSRAHRERTKFDMTTEGKSPQGTYLKYKLEPAYISSYNLGGAADGSARVVVEVAAAPAGSPDGG